MDPAATIRAIVDGVLAVVEGGAPALTDCDPNAGVWFSTWREPVFDTVAAHVTVSSGAIVVEVAANGHLAVVPCASVEAAVAHLVPVVRRIRAT